MQEFTSATRNPNRLSDKMFCRDHQIPSSAIRCADRGIVVQRAIVVQSPLDRSKLFGSHGQRPRFHEVMICVEIDPRRSDLPRRPASHGLDRAIGFDGREIVGHGRSGSLTPRGTPSSKSTTWKSVTSLMRFSLGNRCKIPLKLTTAPAVRPAREGIFLRVQLGPGEDLLALVEQGEADLAGRTRVIPRRLAAELIHIAEEAIDPRLGHRPQPRGQGLGDVEDLLPEQTSRRACPSSGRNTPDQDAETSRRPARRRAGAAATTRRSWR